MTVKRTNPAYLNGVPELLVLRLLARGPLHGYELVQAIRVSSGEVLDFGEGCIYPILHRLEANGQLRTERATIGGRTRVIYHVTPSGRRHLAKSVAAWEQVVAAVRQVLTGTLDGQPELA